MVFGGEDTKSKDKEEPTTTKQQETTTEKETSTEKESESLTEQETETTSEEPTTEEPTTEQSKDNAVIESGDNEQLIPAGHEKYFYVQCGMRLGWNDSAKMGYEAGGHPSAPAGQGCHRRRNPADGGASGCPAGGYPAGVSGGSLRQLFESGLGLPDRPAAGGIGR